MNLLKNMSKKIIEFLKTNEFLKLKENQFYCELCCKVLNDKSYYKLSRHVNTYKHEKQLELNSKKNQDNSKFDFKYDLCKALVQSGIPLSVVEKNR